MDLINYTGKLNKHDKYIEILKKLRKKCTYIEIVVIARRKMEENQIVVKFKDDIIKIDKVREWWGTRSCKNFKVRIKASKELFQYLSKLETFCKYYKESEETILKYKTRGDIAVDTDFGYDDIAFFNKDNNILLCTTTHEGYIFVNEKLLEKKEI